MADVSYSALPYLDTDYEHPLVRQMVNNLVEEEKKTFRPSAKTYLSRIEPAPEFNAERYGVLAAEFERVAKGAAQTPMDMSRYELPPPSKAEQGSVEAWQQSVHNAQAQLEHQLNRIDNLELLNTYGVSAWKKHVSSLEAAEKYFEQRLTKLKQQLQELNWQRKSEQVQAGRQMYELEVRWGELINKNLEVAAACKALEQSLPPQQQPSS
eukprot:m.52398 g.52398  ORF g.52398 m.52398 type:complete len:210 (-) comp13069_c0_seq1:313-942(-)